MFRCKQRFVPSGSCTIFLESDKVLENGVVERTKIDVSSIVLPPVENYNLGVLLKAGVPLQQVNCKVISSNSISLNVADFESSKSETVKSETANNKEI